jgi:hypothetical protein
MSMAATLFIMFRQTVGAGYQLVKQLHESPPAPACRQPSSTAVTLSRLPEKSVLEPCGKTLGARGLRAQGDEHS